MLNEKQIERMLGKLAKFEEKLGTMLFDKVDELPMLRTDMAKQHGLFTIMSTLPDI